MPVTLVNAYPKRILILAEFNYGGQAVIEGVMMRGASHAAVAVRNPRGDIIIHDEPLTAPIYTSAWGKLPFIRGLALLWDALGLGMRSLMWSANVAIEDETDVSFHGPVAWGTVAVAGIFGIGIFFILPFLVARAADSYVPSTFVSHIIEGVLRLALFLAYIIAIGQLPDIKRVFAYHGAEHMTINAYEAGAELTPPSVARFSLLHPRCGTGFLLIVMVVSIFVFSFIGRPNLLWSIAARIVLIPVIAGISYEFIRFSAKRYQTNALIRLLITPSLALQRLTTRPPDAGMLEVAIASLTSVLSAEGRLTEAPQALPTVERAAA